MISPRSRSQCTYTTNPCPVHNSSLPCWVKIIFHTLIVYEPRMCHDLYPRSYLRVHGQSTHIPKTGPQVMTARLDLDNISRNRIMTLTRDISPRSSSQCTHGKIFFQDHYLSWVSQMGMILHTIVIYDPGVVAGGYISC